MLQFLENLLNQRFLRQKDVVELISLSPMTEKVVQDGTKEISLYTYRETSHDGRVVVIVKAFRQRFLRSDAAAEGFAITSNGEIADLDEEERSTLY